MSMPTITIRFYHVKDLRLDFLSMCYVVVLFCQYEIYKAEILYFFLYSAEITFITLLSYLCLYLKKIKSNDKIYEMFPVSCGSVG